MTSVQVAELQNKLHALVEEYLVQENQLNTVSQCYKSIASSYFDAIRALWRVHSSPSESASQNDSLARAALNDALAKQQVVNTKLASAGMHDLSNASAVPDAQYLLEESALFTSDANRIKEREATAALVSSLEQQLNDKSQVIHSKNEEISSLNSTISSMQTEIVGLQREISTLKMKLEVSNEETNLLQNSLAELQSAPAPAPSYEGVMVHDRLYRVDDVERLIEQVNILKVRASTPTINLPSSQYEPSTLKKQVEELSLQLQEFKEKYNVDTSALQDSLHEAEEANVALANIANSLREDMASLADKYATQCGANDMLRIELADVNSKFISLQYQNNDLAKKASIALQELEQQVNSLTAAQQTASKPVPPPLRAVPPPKR
jgi:predicted  nucleic acid-binding Zn-ribbon protein